MENSTMQPKPPSLTLMDRMKAYESAAEVTLERNQPVIIRVDGRSFSTFTRGYEKPFDPLIVMAFEATVQEVMPGIQNCKLAYQQSDEISFCLDDSGSPATEPWFGNKVSKLVSMTAAMVTAAFNDAGLGNTALFDARAFSLPDWTEVENYFIWRWEDCQRNSLSSFSRSIFSHREMMGKNSAELTRMLESAGRSWSSEVKSGLRFGFFWIKSEKEKELTEGPNEGTRVLRRVFEKFEGPSDLRYLRALIGQANELRHD